MTIYISHLSPNIYFCPASLQLLAAYHFSFLPNMYVSLQDLESAVVQKHTHTHTMAHKTPCPNVTIPSQRFMWVKMYTVIVILCVCEYFWESEYIKVQVQLLVFVCLWSVWPRTLTDGWSWWTPVCHGHERYMVLWTRFTASPAASLSGSWVRTSACVRQHGAPPLPNVSGFPPNVAKVCVCIMFSSLLMTFTVSVKCCRFMMPLFRFLWTWEVGSDCWLLHIDNQTHRIVYSISNRSSFDLVFQTVRCTQ